MVLGYTHCIVVALAAVATVVGTHSYWSLSHSISNSVGIDLEAFRHWVTREAVVGQSSHWEDR